MSTPTWLHDAQALSTTENGAYATPADPSITFIPTPTTTGFDYNQLQHQQLQHRLQNGTVRNGSPALNNPVYPTQPLIPSKRARPREDSIGASPRQNPGALPASRSQTPQQVPYPGFPGTVNGSQPFQAASSYQQLQQPSSSASLSPVVQNQHFTPQAGPQRVQTTSPSPFSPGAQNFGTQASPAHSDHGSRVSTPQNGGQMYGPNLSHSAGPSQSFSPPLGSNIAGPSMSPYGQTLEPLQQRQKMHEMRMRQLQASGSPAPIRNHGEALNTTINPPIHMPSYQLGLARPQQAQKSGRPSSSEQFVRGVAQYMQQRGLPFNPHLTVVGRPINLLNIFSLVMRQGGSKKLTTEARWTQTAEYLAIPQDHWLAAAHEIQSYWAINLSPYEVWWQQSQRQRAAMNEQMRLSQNVPGGEIPSAHGQYSPPRQAGSQMHEQQKPQFVHGQMQPQPKFQTPVRHITPQQHEAFQPNQNGYMIPQHVQARHRQPNLYGPSQPGVNPQHQMQPQQPQAPAVPSETIVAKKKPPAGAKDGPAMRPSSATDLYREIQLPEIFRPRIQVLGTKPGETQTHGGVEVEAWKDIIDRLLYLKPNVPAVEELGVVDIRALTMSLRSGIHAEVRYALDTLCLLSNHGKQPLIRECEDLLEVLIECAEDQVELLAENAAEVSDAMLISSYEEIARGCRIEVESLQEVHQFGSLEYELDRSVDRLICVTTILRNLSFPPNSPRQLVDPSNQRLLASSVVVKFFAGVIRYLGTRNMLLRTQRNTLDFANDVVVYFSNVSHDIDLPGREEALCILHFLLSFAPSPPPTSPGDDDFHFTPYSPLIHPYYPPAVDSLAKLLARDDPNRTLYRAIFLADVTTTPPYDLLTRSFGLAIATVPEFGKEGDFANEDRKAVLAQGLLAAEILAGLIPGSDHVLARSWLSSQDGFALSLAKLVFKYSQHISQLPPRYSANARTAELADPRGERMITSRGLAVLRRLMERARDTENRSDELPVGIMPQRQDLLRFLLRAEMDVSILQQLCNYSDLGT